MRDFGSFLIWRVSILFFFYWAPKLPVLALIQIDWIQMDLCLPHSRVLVLPSLSDPDWVTLLCNVTTEHSLHLSLPKQIQRLFFLGPPSGKTEANRRGTERTAPNSRARARIATPIPPRVARGRRGRRPPVCRQDRKSVV